MPNRALTSYGPSIVVLITAAVVLLAGPYAVRTITFAHTSARIEQASHRLAHGDNILAQLNQAYRDIAAAVEPSVVHISAQRPALPLVLSEGRRSPRMSLSSGSGWIYDEHGHLVTNYHVVEEAQNIEVQLYTGEIRSAEIVGYDRTTDIAVLRIAPGRLHPAMRADITGREQVQQGDIVFAFGSPFDFRFSMSSGVVSGKGRYVGIIRQQFGIRQVGFENFIQTDAAINPGNSGGPLTDVRGRVIGMNTAIATAMRRTPDGRPPTDEGQFGGVGLAIPLEMIEPVVSQIISNGTVEKGYLGIVVLDRTDPLLEELRAMGFAEGSGVPVARGTQRLVELGAALLPGDVVTQIDREPVYTPEQILARSILDADDDRTIELTLWRFDPDRNHGVRVRVEVGREGAEELRNVQFLPYDAPIIRRLEYLGFTGHGVLIAGVQEGAPAGPAGLRAFDVVTHVNGQPLSARSQLQSIISSMIPDQTALLRVWRFDRERHGAVTLEVPVQLARLDLPVIAGLVPAPEIAHEPEDRDDSDEQRDWLLDLGIAKMSTATPQRLRELGQTPVEGVLIEEIASGSRLDGRIPPASVIVSVGGRSVRSVDELLAALVRLHPQPAVPIAFRDPQGNFTTDWLEIE